MHPISSITVHNRRSGTPYLNDGARSDNKRNEMLSSPSCLRRIRLKLCPKYTVPEAARNAEAILIVREVVLHVVFSELAVVEGKAIAIFSNCG